MRPSFSVAVLARNEGPHLPRLLASLGEFMRRGGEVVVLDTGSTDDTVAVARGAGCRVRRAGTRFEGPLGEAAHRRIRRALGDDVPASLFPVGQRQFRFGAARQQAASLARHDFVLHLDACDEVLALDLDFLDSTLKAGGVDRFYYTLRLGDLRLAICRFHDRRRLRWAGRVHETLVGRGAGPAMPVTCPEECLAVRHHKDEARRRDYYLTGLALDALDHPADPRWKHYLGRQLVYQGCHRAALPWLEEHSGLDSAWAPERSESLCLAGECHEVLGEPEEAAAAYERAFRTAPGRREPLLRLARLARGRGDLAGAAGWASRALEVPPGSPFAEAEANYTWGPHAELYWSLFWLGRREEARRHWEECRRLAPEDPRFREDGRLFHASGASSGDRVKYAVATLRLPGWPHSAAFDEAAEALHGGLEELGLDSVLTDDLALADRQYFVFGWNAMSRFQGTVPAGAFLVNMEPVLPHACWPGPDDLERLRRFVVLDYSLGNLESWERLGLDEVLHLPLGYASRLTRIPPAQEDIDVLFYGSLNPRRTRILEELRRRGLRVEASACLYGPARDDLIARSRIVLNMHYYVPGLFEMARVFYLLANQRFVVSEYSGPCEYTAKLGPGLVLAPYEGLVEACLRYLDCPEERAAIAATGFERLRAFPQSEPLRRLLAGRSVVAAAP